MPTGRRPAPSAASTIPGLAAAPAPGLAAAEAAAARGPAGLGDLGRGVAQRRADLVDLDLVDRALLAFLGLVRPLPQPPGHDDPHAALQRLGDVLGRLPPDVAGQEQRVAVLPLVGVPVEEPRGGGYAEVGDGLAGRRVTQLRVIDKVADDGDLGVSCGHRVLPVARVVSGPALSRALRSSTCQAGRSSFAGPPRSG